MNKKHLFSIAWMLSLTLNTAYALELEPQGLGEAIVLETIKEVKETLPVSFKEKLQISVKIKEVPVLLKKRKALTGFYSDLDKSIYLHPRIFFDKELLKQTLFHELAHAYEYRVEKQWKKPSYQIIAGYHKRGIIFKTLKKHNYKTEASPDSYEYKEAKESFPVNFEYFMTDADYQCRRPLLNKYMEDLFGVSPFPKKDCQYPDELPVWVQGKVLWEKVDMSRLYQVHYLFASEGEEIMSRWGHAMIRLVLCAPERKEKSDACLKDISHHLVISYRANVQDISINYFKGLLGVYKSEAYIFPMIEIMREYNKTELRDLISLPLNLNEEKLERFKILLKEAAYTFHGRYRFFTNNCATETLNFFQALLDDPSIHQLNTLSPLGLLRKLQQKGIVPSDLLTDKELAIKQTYFFGSQKSAVEAAFTKIQKLYPAKKLKHYLEETTAQGRKEIWEKAELTRDQLASFILLERQINEKKQKDLMEVIAKKVQKQLGKKNAPEEIGIMEEVRKNYLANNELPPLKTYGLPYASEFSVPTEQFVEQDRLEKAGVWVKENFSSELKELETVIDNINNLTERLKNLLRRDV